jgi:predicted solute-binding protein
LCATLGQAGGFSQVFQDRAYNDLEARPRLTALLYGLMRDYDDNYDPPLEPPIEAWHCHHLGVWPFLAGRVMLGSLLGRDDVKLIASMPAEMPTLLQCDLVEAALVEAIDLPTVSDCTSVLPAPALLLRPGSLLVRLFSRVHPDMLEAVWVDEGSRQAGAVAQILWGMKYGRQLQLVPFDASTSDPPDDAQATVIVGDRVVVSPPMVFDYQIDLAGMWHRQTGMPLPWGVWVAGAAAHTHTLSQMLTHSLWEARQHAAAWAGKLAMGHDWPMDLACRELTSHLTLVDGDAVAEALDEFFHLATLFGVLAEGPVIHFHDGG